MRQESGWIHRWFRSLFNRFQKPCHKHILRMDDLEAANWRYWFIYQFSYSYLFKSFFIVLRSPVL